MAIVRPKSKQAQQRQGLLLLGLVVVMAALQLFADVDWSAMISDALGGG